MRGFPDCIKTKQDVQNLSAAYPAETKAFLQSLLDTLDMWKTTGTVASESAGVTDTTHRVLTDKDMISGTTTYLQQELVQDPNAALFRLGYTVADAQALVASL